MLGKTILAAVVAAVLASIVTTLIITSVADDRARLLESRIDAAEKRANDAEDSLLGTMSRIDRYEARVERAEAGLTETRRVATAAAQAAGADMALESGALVAPDGSPYLSRGEVEELLAERGLVRGGDGTGMQNVQPILPKTLEEIAAEMGLTAQQEATLRVILRDGEQEIVNRLFGNRSLESVREEILRAKDDPDASAELINTVAMRAVGNLGYLLTHEKRVRTKVRDALGEEQAAEFFSRPHKPVLGDEFEKVFEGLFN